jgi:ring-1,2-phenylacetyl-CoA epoxidase subunit PaaA
MTSFVRRWSTRRVQQIDYMGLRAPDPDVKWNEERGHYDFGAIDWDEFYNVIKGNGPCNKERLQTRIKTHANGSWFREALVANATKRATRARSAAA